MKTVSIHYSGSSGGYDDEIRQRDQAKCEFELRWDPDIKSDDIAVAVDGGVVTLTGFVRSYSQRREAEIDAKRVAGVGAVANDIQVRLPIIHRRPDPEIARDVASALKAQLQYTQLGWHSNSRQKWLGYSRRAGRVELRARASRGRRTAHQRCERDHQLDPGGLCYRGTPLRSQAHDRGEHI